MNRLHPQKVDLELAYSFIASLDGKQFSRNLLVLEGFSHTRSSWADFNHGLVVRPQGCQGSQKINKNILQINLLSYCANIQPILKKLRSSTKNQSFLMASGGFLKFIQYWLNISKLTQQIYW